MKKLSLLLLAAVMVVILTVSMASVTSAANPLVPYQLEEYGQLSYNIYEAAKNPTVDGVVSEGEYGDPIRVFNLGDEGTMVDDVLLKMDEATRKIVVSRDCTVYMTFNDVYLYVAVTCIDDSHMTPGYGQEVWDGDYLEFDMIRISDDFSETPKEKRLVFAIGINNDGEMCAWYDRVPEYSDGSCAGVIWQEANNNAAVTLKNKLATYEFRMPWKGILGTNGAPESALYYVNVGCSDEEYYELSEYACYLGALRNTPPASEGLKAEIEALGGKGGIFNRLYFIKNAPDTSAAESAYSFTEGLVSDPQKPVKTARALEQMPRTFDVIVQLSPNYEERAGVIVGNYAGSSAAISFEVQAGGLPRLYYKDEAENVYDHVFENVDMRSKTPVRLTLVQNPASKTITCYIDGKEVGRMDCAEGFPDALIPSNEQMIGGDFRGGNGQYFKGTIYKVDLYSDALTADQIASGNGTGLLASYDFTTEANKSADLSGNGYDLISEMDFLNEGSVISEEPTEPTYIDPAPAKEAPTTSSQLDEVLEAKAEAPNTFDFGVVAVIAAVISLGGFAVSRKHK